MKNLLLLFVISFSFCFNWIDYDGEKINGNIVVVKVFDQVAPKLGIEEPLDYNNFQGLKKIMDSYKTLDFNPLFIGYKNFNEKHYKHELHSYYIIEFNDVINFDLIKRDLMALDFVEDVEPSYMKSINLVPNDSYYSDQWGHDNTGQATSYGGGYVGTPDCDTDTDLAWDITTGSEETIISIIDTGVNEHSELSGKIVGGFDFINNDYDAYDDNGHGTACAGIAAAIGNNGQGIAGVCWDCLVMPIKVLGADGYGDDNGISNGIIWSTDNDADVISMSLGGGGYASYTDSAINYATENGTVVLSASGNDNAGSVSYPSAYTNSISVGALSPCNERKSTNSCDGENYWGSNYGTGLDFLAPGVRINTITSSGGYTSTFNGTSSACPHAAGIAGLIKSIGPGIGAEDVRLIMQLNSHDLGNPGFDTQTGYGRVNAYNSVFNLLNSSEVYIDIESMMVELNSGESLEEVFVVANIGELDLEYSIDPNGYRWETSSNENISYEWIDISNDNTTIVFDNNDQASSTNIELDFDFKFYNQLYESFIVNPNGWIGFEDDNDGWDNIPIPDPAAPQSAVFGFWDDLNPVNNSGNGQGYVRYHGNNQRMVVWFDNVQHWPTNFEGSVYDFQIVLYSTGDISLNYRNMQGRVDSATIGIQNSEGNQGILMNYNYDLVSNDFSIETETMPNWLEISPLDGIIEPGGIDEVFLLFHADDLEEGNYDYTLEIKTNDYQNPQVEIPIYLSVLEDECAGWLLGDLNNDYTLNINDVVIMVNIVLGQDASNNCQLVAADTNYDGDVNVLDILILVNTILD